MNVLLHFQSSFRRRQKWIVFSEIYVESLRMSFRKSISQTLVFGQLLGLMPICGITSDLSDLKFKWKSFRCLHFVVVLLGAASLLILTLLFLRQHQELSLENIDTVIVYSTNIVTIVLFFRLRHQWQRLIECWDNFECRLNLDNSELQRQSNLRLILVVASSLAEYTLQTLTVLSNVKHCEDSKLAKVFFVRTYPAVFAIVSYHPLIGFMFKIVSYVIELTWAYRDLFVINLAASLCHYFTKFNKQLLLHKGSELSDGFWRRQRSLYHDMADLVRQVDKTICGITFLSFAVNLYFICVHLFNGLYWSGELLNSIYSWFSFVSLVVRTLTMAITAANLHEESKKPRKMLRSVSRESWSEEVKIFNRELAFDVIALTGLNLFSITRKFMLSVAAKIITYEIFLIQLQQTTEIRETNANFCDV